LSLELSTAGIKVKWAVETTAGTRPTTGYTQIRGVKSIPSYNPEPSNHEVTDLSNIGWKRYIPGMKDPGGALGLTVNHYEDFMDDWSDMLTAFATAKADGKALWIEYAIPSIDSFYYQAVPSELGFNGADVDGVLENVAYLTPNSAPVWAVAST